MKTLVIAPHPDDELLGCGGTILKRLSEGNQVGWLLITAMTESGGWKIDDIRKKNAEIDCVRKGLGINSAHFFSLGIESSTLDTLPLASLILKISNIFKNFQPEELFLPHPGDAHSDHRVVFDAVSSCTKWFRYPSIKRVLTYETLSETDISIQKKEVFKPNSFINIEGFEKKKIELLNIYQSEIGNFPFPRSIEAVTSLMHIRGSRGGFLAAEAFELLLEREN